MKHRMTCGLSVPRYPSETVALRREVLSDPVGLPHQSRGSHPFFRLTCRFLSARFGGFCALTSALFPYCSNTSERMSSKFFRGVALDNCSAVVHTCGGRTSYLGRRCNCVDGPANGSADWQDHAARSQHPAEHTLSGSRAYLSDGRTAPTCGHDCGHA